MQAVEKAAPACSSRPGKSASQGSGSNGPAKNGNTAGALAVPQRAEPLDPGPKAVFGGSRLVAQQAVEYQQAGQLAHAATKLREAIQLEADPIFALQHGINLGHIFSNLGDRPRGLQILNEMLSRLLKLRRKLPPAARQRLDQLEVITRVNLSSVLEDDRLCRVHLEKAMHLDSKCPAALVNMANLLLREANYHEAITCASKILLEKPQDIPSLGIIMKSYEALGRHTEAVRAFIKISGIDTASTYVALKEVFHCRASDVFINTYPRCGTTWMVQVVVSTLFGLEADYNDKAVFVEGMLATDPEWIWSIEKMGDPRIMKMHSPMDVFPGLARNSNSELQDEGKIIYIVRNPKDALLSLRRHHENNKSIKWEGSLDRWIDEWIAGRRSEEYGGSYFVHVKDWWSLSRRYPKRVKIVYFEDMKADLAAVVLDVALFLGVEVAPDQIGKIVERCSFEEMKSRHKVPDDMRDRLNPQHFFKGEVSRWRNELSKEQARRVDEATWKHLRQEVEEGLKIHDLEPI